MRIQIFSILHDANDLQVQCPAETMPFQVLLSFALASRPLDFLKSLADMLRWRCQRPNTAANWCVMTIEQRRKIQAAGVGQKGRIFDGDLRRVDRREKCERSCRERRTCAPGPALPRGTLRFLGAPVPPALKEIDAAIFVWCGSVRTPRVL